MKIKRKDCRNYNILVSKQRELLYTLQLDSPKLNVSEKSKELEEISNEIESYKGKYSIDSRAKKLMKELFDIVNIKDIKTLKLCERDKLIKILNGCKYRLVLYKAYNDIGPIVEETYQTVCSNESDDIVLTQLKHIKKKYVKRIQTYERTLFSCDNTANKQSSQANITTTIDEILDNLNVPTTRRFTMLMNLKWLNNMCTNNFYTSEGELKELMTQANEYCNNLKGTQSADKELRQVYHNIKTIFNRYKVDENIVGLNYALSIEREISSFYEDQYIVNTLDKFFEDLNNLDPVEDTMKKRHLVMELADKYSCDLKRYYSRILKPLVDEIDE